MDNNIDNMLRGSDIFRKIYSQYQTRLLGKHLNQELYESTLTLKNLAIVRKETPLSADYIFEALMENSNYLKPVYKEMINMYRSGRPSDAFIFFGEETGTRNGKNFASILEKIDKINPNELVGQIMVYQNMMAETHMTEQEKEAENRSLIVTIASTATIFALLINFTVVVVFLDTLSTLSNLF